MTWRAGWRTVGYYVLLPNLYYRAGKDTKYGADVLEKGSAEQARMRAVRTKMTIPPVMDDVAALIAFADAQKESKKGPVGTHGYCMSGPYSLAAAARYPDRIAAAASFYGTWLVSDAVESPHLTLGKAKGELYISCAEHDELAPPDMVKELKALFDKSGNGGELEIQMGVHHGFAFPQRWCYDKPAAERHWERLIALYRRRLGYSSSLRKRGRCPRSGRGSWASMPAHDPRPFGHLPSWGGRNHGALVGLNFCTRLPLSTSPV